MMTFTDAEHDRIREAVRLAESNTSGEIVAYLMESSDHYGVAYLRSLLFFCASAVLISFGVLLASEGWGLGWLETAAGIAVVAVLGALFGLLVVWAVPPAFRFFAGTVRMARTTRLQAFRAFVEEEVFATKDRTGILVFVSLREHRVEVLADKGINSVVDDGVWHEVVNLIITGIRQQTLTDGLVAGIAKCGDLLHQHGIEIQTPDTNELSNDLRIRREL